MGGRLRAYRAFIFALGVFYATTSGTHAHHSTQIEKLSKAHTDAVEKMTKVMEDEGKKREAMAHAEAAKRDELRKEYLASLDKQTTTFATIGEKLSGISTKVEVMTSKYDTTLTKMNDDLRKVLDQTRAPQPPTWPAHLQDQRGGAATGSTPGPRRR